MIKSLSVVTLLVAAALVAALPVGSDAPLRMGDANLKQLAAEAGWIAGVNPRFEGMTIAEVTRMLGDVHHEAHNAPRYLPSTNLAAIPESFDAREQWPSCVHPVRDQGQCGSCWAFAATEAFSDRLCIHSNSSVDEVLSPQYSVSCDTLKNDHGCSGGWGVDAWSYFETTGAVSESCVSYTSGSTGKSGTCTKKCDDGSALKFHKIAKGTSTQSTGSVKDMQAQLMEGPIHVSFLVYSDFMSYTGGIYSHVSGSMMGGHSVKMIGWGEEDGTPYWLVANSWGPSWGENGFFRIKRGEDMCGMESRCCIAGTPSE